MLTKNMVFIVALVMLLTGCGNVTRPSQYLVEFQVSENGSVIGSPSVLISPEKEASFSVNGEAGFELVFNVTLGQPELTLVDASLTTGSGVFKPMMLVGFGRTAKVSNSEMGLTVLVNEVHN